MMPAQQDIEFPDTSGHEILDYVLLALEENPKRLDLWMMRFEIVRSLGLKDGFVRAMQNAYADRDLRTGIDWKAVRELWDELAPGEPPPEGVRLPASRLADEAAATPGRRRFADLAGRRATAALQALAADYGELRQQADFFRNFARATREHLNRPTPLSHARKLAEALDFDGQILLKREDQHHCSPEREYAIAQCYVATALGRQQLICANEVDGFAFELARAAPQFGLQLSVVMQAEELTNASLVQELKKRGAHIISTEEMQLDVADAREGALKLWAPQAGRCHLALSFGAGPHPYPRMINDFQMLLGQETALQLRANHGGNKRQIVISAVQSEADAIGFMLPFLRNPGLELLLADVDPASTRSSGALRWANYHGARREHAWLRATGHITYIPIRDAQAAEAQQQLANIEGLQISFEDARAMALTCGLVEGGVADRDLVVLIA